MAIHAPLAGTLVAVVMGPIFGMLPGGFWASAGVLALGIGALSSLIAGLRSVLGIGGFVLGAVFNMLFANPLAGTMAPKEFVVGNWGALGQHLPNGATATLVRSVNYFPSAPIGQPVWTLLAWIAVGVCLLGGRDGARPARRGCAKRRIVGRKPEVTSGASGFGEGKSTESIQHGLSWVTLMKMV